MIRSFFLFFYFGEVVYVSTVCVLCLKTGSDEYGLFDSSVIFSGNRSLPGSIRVGNGEDRDSFTTKLLTWY